MPKKRAASSDPDSDGPQAASAGAKKARTSESSSSVPGGGARDANGDAYWEIAAARRVTVSEFKGRTMISVREYYEKDGQTLPGKKGITMPMAQFAALVQVLPAVEQVLKGKGEQLQRPNYGVLEGGGAEREEEGEKEKGAEKRRNFEETSEED